MQANRRQLMLGLAASVASTLSATQAHAGHHFEITAVRQNPRLSTTDLYVFKAAEGDRTVFIFDFNNAPKAGEDLLEPNAIYNIHCATDSEFKQGMTLSFSADAGKVNCHLLPEPNGKVGALGEKMASLALGAENKLANGMRIWVGHAHDPFFGNSPGLGAFRAQLGEGQYDPEVWRKASGHNIFLGRTCCSVVVEVPNNMLGSRIKVFTTVAEKKDNGWSQVQYMAKNLISHSMLFENETLKVAFDASRPDTQAEFMSFFAARIARSVHFAKSHRDPFAYADATAKRLLPDVMTYDVGTEANYSPDKLNGRKLSDDAMSTMLTLLLGQPTSQVVTDQKLYDSTFPYVRPV